MTTLTVNGVNLLPIIAAADLPKVERRDIGDVGPALSGTMRVTRQTRKRDLGFKSIPLNNADAFSWESFLIGEGEVFSFDSGVLGLYGSKGLPFSAQVGATLDATHPKFGGTNLRLGATTGTITYPAAVNLAGASIAWTVCVWRYESSAWRHYIVRNDGAKWVDGVRNDAATTTWLSVSGGSVTLANTSGSPVDYDDLVVFPFAILSSWAPVFGVATAAFPPLPYLDAAGNQVPEAATRRVFGQVSGQTMKIAGGTRQVLDVELKAK